MIALPPRVPRNPLLVTEPDIAPDDILHRFLIERPDVRGVIVRLNDSWRTIRSREDYPPQVAALLGQAAAASALLTGHAKVEGRLSVQLKGTAPVRTLFAECTHAGTLRGLAHWSEPLPDALTPRALGADALLAITIENQGPGAREPQRYQGLVDLDADTLAAALENYFVQSEQLPTRLLLAADADRACGLMIQMLPGTSGDIEGWDRAQHLFATLGPDELLAAPPEQLLYRLFHEDGVRVLASRPLAFGCSCSTGRVQAMLRGLGHDEALAAAEHTGGHAEITCEFCGQRYRFDLVEIEALFAGPAAPGSDSVQ